MAEAAPEGYLDRIEALKGNIARVIQGKDEAIELLLIALFSGGSVLMEDVPGVGKTTLAKTLAKSIDAAFNRVQFTPDLLPSDIVGASIYNPQTGAFLFREGPVFCNVLLADEINRASPRTQSALLEAMGEGQATIEGRYYALPSPFLVLATQNPIDFHGTYPLPEAQLDRFLLLLNLGYPEADKELDILFSLAEKHPVDAVSPVMTREDVLGIQQAIRRVHVEKNIARYMVTLVRETRADNRLKLGVSPRGSLMLFRAAQSTAYLSGRSFVLPDDVQRIAPEVLSHRLLLTSKSKYGGANKREIVVEILGRLKAPV
jgi:MoxR-like ATPase